MLSKPGRFVVMPAGHPIPAAHTAAHRRDFPEVRPPEGVAARRADPPARTPDEDVRAFPARLSVKRTVA